MSLNGPLLSYQRRQIDMVTYPYNDTSLPQAQRDYLKKLTDFAAEQDLSEDLRGYVRSISIAFTVFAGFVVGLRFLARRRQAAQILTDDYLMLLAMVLLIGNMAMNLVLVEHGLGLHSGALSLEELQFLERVMIGAEVIYVTAVNMYKIALLFLYFRIFPVRQVRVGGYICGGVSTAWNVACVVAASAQCTPLHRLWEPWVEGTCIDLFLTQLCISVPSILCDIAILCLPIPHVMRLQMDRVQRALVLFIFLLGSYVVFTSIYRFRVYLDYTRDDVPYSLAKPCAWNIIEISSGIISACLPTLGPIIRLLFKGVLPSSFKSSAKKYLSNGGKNSAVVTIGGGTGTNQHGRSASKEWSKLPGSNEPSASREESKYGISMTAMRGRDDSSSTDIELVTRFPQGGVHVTVESPRDAVHPHTHTRSGAGSENDDGSSREGDEYPLTKIWKHQEIQQKVETVSESAGTRLKRKSTRA